MNCSLCCEIKPILWNDYCSKSENSKALFIGLCYDCLSFLGCKETKTLISQVQNCVICQNKFIPKISRHSKCFDCWKNPIKVKFNDGKIKPSKIIQNKLFVGCC